MEILREVQERYNFLISKAAPSQFPEFRNIFRKAPQLCKDVPYYFETCTAKIPQKNQAVVTFKWACRRERGLALTVI
jgi:hypothetical protein